MKKKSTIFLVSVLLFLIIITPVYAIEEFETIKLRDDVHIYGDHVFSNGIIPIIYKNSISENGNWAYLTEDGNIFSHRYASGFEYSEGLAPIVMESEENGHTILKLGYINRRGKTIIEPKFDVYSKEGITYAGKFINGEALVFEYAGNADNNNITGDWYKINRNGKRINTDKKENSLLMESKDKDILLSNDKYSSNYEIKEDIKLYGKELKDIKFKNNKSLVRINSGENRGLYIISKKINEEKNPMANSIYQKILVNDKEVFLPGFNIDDKRYFKLRDIGFILNGTEKQFEIVWNEKIEEIDIRLETPYTVIGGETAKINGDKTRAALNKYPIFINGEIKNLKSYEIIDNNFVNLKDIGKELDINIKYEKDTIIIDTNKDYYSS